MAIEEVTLDDGRKRVFITAGTTEWPDPSDFNPASNLIECVGAGGIAAAYAVGMGAGGGGATYAFADNVNPVFPVPIYVPTSGTSSVSSGNADGTKFGGTAATLYAQTYCFAGNGASATDVTAGGAGAITYPNPPFNTRFGGQGGPGRESLTGSGGSGGGVAGPNGNGGHGSGGFPPGAPGGVANAGVPFQWDASHVLGNGGVGANESGVGGNAAGFGGGAGGGNSEAGIPGPGLIVITYEPHVVAAAAIAIIMS